MLIPVNTAGTAIVDSKEVLAILQAPKRPAPSADTQQAADIELQTLVFVKGAAQPLMSDIEPATLGNFVNEANGVPLTFEICNVAEKLKAAKDGEPHEQ